MVDGSDPVEVWGDGTASRDFIYVSDMVESLLKALEVCATCEPLNIGSGESVAIKDVVDRIVRLSGRSMVRIQYDASKPVTIHKQSLDVSTARSVLGFQPKVSLDEGLRRTIEWYKEHFAVLR